MDCKLRYSSKAYANRHILEHCAPGQNVIYSCFWQCLNRCQYEAYFCGQQRMKSQNKSHKTTGLVNSRLSRLVKHPGLYQWLGYIYIKIGSQSSLKANTKHIIKIKHKTYCANIHMCLTICLSYSELSAMKTGSKAQCKEASGVLVYTLIIKNQTIVFYTERKSDCT